MTRSLRSVQRLGVKLVEGKKMDGGVYFSFLLTCITRFYEHGSC